MKKNRCGRNSCLSGGICQLISFGEEAEQTAETTGADRFVFLWPDRSNKTKKTFHWFLKINSNLLVTACSNFHLQNCLFLIDDQNVIKYYQVDYCKNCHCCKRG